MFIMRNSAEGLRPCLSSSVHAAKLFQHSALSLFVFARINDGVSAVQTESRRSPLLGFSRVHAYHCINPKPKQEILVLDQRDGGLV